MEILRKKKGRRKMERERLKLLLSECTAKQRAMFLHIYPEGVDKMPKRQLPLAILQVQNTIRRNKLKGETDGEET